MSDSTITFVILGAAVVFFVWDYLPVEFVAVGAALSLYATGVLNLGQSVAGFGDQTASTRHSPRFPPSSSAFVSSG